MAVKLWVEACSGGGDGGEAKEGDGGVGGGDAIDVGVDGKVGEEAGGEEGGAMEE